MRAPVDGALSVGPEWIASSALAPASKSVALLFISSLSRHGGAVCEPRSPAGACVRHRKSRRAKSPDARIHPSLESRCLVG
ncbi:hypothetical protein NDU88_000441 [Pleurodeles waltl]|uniref:Uncharacterized protein n=1 Tax=Pleurodeles waltl TaxID=8319 RepID=A0AAV7Q073_PLEWA|nr:hypothetical protein NDU88_000441 [Pleurodeles waltl]